MSDGNEEKQRLVKHVNRQQMSWRAVDVERLIEPDHRARAIWELVGRLDLRRFHEVIKSTEEEGGRPAFDPQLLISLWVYAQSQGIGSAREIERRCEWDPAFQWLAGLEVVNYHTLADFRVQRKEELDELFTQLLGVLSAEGLVSLEQVTLDGTKIRAQASNRSFRREKTLREHLELARQRVKELEEAEGSDEVSQRIEKAQARARREKQARLEQALEELEKVREQKKSEEDKSEVRASSSDPQARRMKQPDGGFALSYNAQISSDSAQGIIVDVEVTQAGNDFKQLLPAVERIEQRLEKKPQQMLVDGGIVSQENVEAIAEQGVDLLGPVPDDAGKAQRDGVGFPAEKFKYAAAEDRYVCPAGKDLSYQRNQQRNGRTFRKYKARWQDCQSCVLKSQCCPENRKHGRSLVVGEESAAMTAFRQKMQTEQAQAQYRMRGPVAEFRNCWIKAKLGLRSFHVRGLVRVQAEMLWACFTHNLQHWILFRRRNTSPLPA